MKKLPLISICIPTYNGEKFIRQALESAYSQTYPNIELVISDDASKDDTLEIIENFSSDKQLSINIYSHKPSGIGANWNNCIKKAKGEYIKFLFQDDILYPTCVEELVALATSDNDAGMVACKRSIITEGKETAATASWMKKYGNLQEGMALEYSEYYLLDSGFLKRDKFLTNNRIGEPSTVLFERSIINKVGYFNEDLVQVLDLEFYYRILKHHNILILNKELASFRIHPGQATNINKDQISKDYEKYYRLLYRDFFWFLGFDSQKKLLKRYHPIGKLYNYLRP